MLLRNLLLISIFIALSNFVSAGAWTKMADFGGATGRHRAVGLSIGNKGYMGTGHINGTGVETYFSDWWEFDPATNSWSQKADYIGNNGQGDLGLVSVSIDDLDVGFVGLGELDPTSFYKYYPASNTWAQVSSPPIGYFNDTRGFTIGQEAYFFGSWGVPIVYSYNVYIDTWTAKTPPVYGISGFYSCFTIDGYGYVKNNYYLFKYDPTIDSWSLVDNFPGLSQRSAQTFVYDDKAYFVSGGYGLNWTPVSEVWVFDPETEEFNRIGDFPGTSRRLAASFTINDIGYLGTGTNGTNFKDFWRFDPSKIVSTKEFSIDKFSAYPNPAFDKVNFRSDQFSDFKVQILNLSGQEIGQEQAINGFTSFSREAHAPGMYIYKVIANGKVVHTDKIIIQ